MFSSEKFPKQYFLHRTIKIIYKKVNIRHSNNNPQESKLQRGKHFGVNLWPSKAKHLSYTSYLDMAKCETIKEDDL